MLTSIWAAVGTCLYVFVPLGTSLLVGLAPIAPAYWYWRGSPSSPSWRPTWLELLLLASAIYLLANATWSLEPRRAYTAICIITIALLSLYIASRFLRHVDRSAINSMVIGFYAGYAAASVVLATDILCGGALTRLLTSLAFNGTPETRMAAPFYLDGLNYNVAALTFLFSPALLVADQLAVKHRLAMYTPFLAGIVAIFCSAHQSSMLAVSLGALAWAMHTVSPRLSRLVITSGWLLACLAVVPAASLAYQHGLHKNPILWASAQHRVVIWGVISQKIAEAPILGQGMVSGRQLGAQAVAIGQRAPGTNFILGPSVHAHSAYLQAWFETGAVGAGALLCIGLLILRAIGHAAPSVQPGLYATFVVNACLAASSFSLWGRMLVPSFVLTSLFAIMAVRNKTADASDAPSTGIVRHNSAVG